MADEPNTERNPLTELLEEMGAFERAVVADADSPTSADDGEAERVARWVDASRRAIPAPGRRRRPRWAPLALASLAATCLIAWSLGWFEPPHSDPKDPIAVGLQPRPIAPVGEASFERFEWSIDGTLPLNTYFRIEVRSTRGTPLSKPVDDLRVQSWHPGRAGTDAWPDSIEWRVSVIRDGTIVDASHWTPAHR